jgi:uncharacterized repeat protein (TIGR03803 family)
MDPSHRISLRLALGATSLAAVAFAGPAATASNVQTIYSFACSSGDCNYGEGPTTGITVGKNGALFGVTRLGGDQESQQGEPCAIYYGCGVLYEWSARSGIEALYQFCHDSTCSDGKYPNIERPLIDKAHNLYGTTANGGAHGKGAVFELVYDRKSKSYTEQVLYSFCARAACADGSIPDSLAHQSPDVPIWFGTTAEGGANGAGTVFLLKYNAAKKIWKEKVLYSFCAQTGCADGSDPIALVHGKGGLYGLTYTGGTGVNTMCEPAGNGCGTAFRVSYNKASRQWVQQVLYDFCSAANCADGLLPNPALAVDAAGNVYGTTFTGGADGAGEVFEVPSGGGLSILHSFTSDDPAGTSPEAGVYLDKAGNLIGTTSQGGGLDFEGSVYEVSNGAVSVLSLFPFQTNIGPPTGVVGVDQSGNVYGALPLGGGYGLGELWEVP